IIYSPLPNLSPVPINGDDFGYFGGPSYLKGFHVLLKALEYHKLQGLVPLTVHATKFYGFDKRLAVFLNEKGIILYNKLESNEMDQVYQKVKTVIVPSIWDEPFGYVVVEALLRGRLVIASRIGGIPELVEGCKGVFLFDAGDITELAEKIEYVNGLNKEKLSKLVIHNKKILLTRFKNQMIVKHFYELFNSIIKTW
ncbi:MAG: glycosyltransferase, partial [Candidatus Bathyarchaeia archaeon]